MRAGCTALLEITLAGPRAVGIDLQDEVMISDVKKRSMPPRGATAKQLKQTAASQHAHISV